MCRGFVLELELNQLPCEIGRQLDNQEQTQCAIT